MKALLIFSFYVASSLGVQAVTHQESYWLWKKEQQRHWTSEGMTATEREYALLESIIENLDEHWQTKLLEKNVLYAYTMLREMAKLPPIHGVKEIDSTWLYQKLNKVWKARGQEVWEEQNATFCQQISDLVLEVNNNLELSQKHPKKTLYKQLALFSYNFLREFLGRAPVSSLSQLDQQWLDEVTEKAEPYAVMEQHGACQATPMQQYLLDEAQRILQLKQKVIALSYGPQSAKAISQAKISYVFLSDTTDLDEQLAALYHELGHIAHNDMRNIQKILDKEITYDTLLADKDFIADIERIDYYTSVGKKALTNETKVGKRINAVLNKNKTLWIKPGAHKLKEMLFKRGTEKRADLHALDSLFSQKWISPILHKIVEFGHANYWLVAVKDKNPHPSYIERALYFAGYLADKGFDVNKLLKDWYATGKCRHDRNLPSLDCAQSLSPRVEVTQGARDVEKAHALWLQKQERREI
jgi:hypothetical protein